MILLPSLMHSLERGVEAVDEIIIDDRCYQTFRDIFCHSSSL